MDAGAAEKVAILRDGRPRGRPPQDEGGEISRPPSCDATGPGIVGVRAYLVPPSLPSTPDTRVIAVMRRFSPAIKLANSCGDRNFASVPRFLNLPVISSNFRSALNSTNHLFVGDGCERQHGQIARHNKQGVEALCKTLILHVQKGGVRLPKSPEQIAAIVRPPEKAWSKAVLVNRCRGRRAYIPKQEACGDARGPVRHFGCIPPNPQFDIPSARWQSTKGHSAPSTTIRQRSRPCCTLLISVAEGCGPSGKGDPCGRPFALWSPGLTPHPLTGIHDAATFPRFLSSAGQGRPQGSPTSSLASARTRCSHAALSQ